MTGLGLTTYSWDPVHQLQRLQGVHSETTTLSYDAAGRRTQIVHGNGVRSSLSYDASSRLTSVVHQTSLSTTLSSYSYVFDGVSNRTSCVANGTDVSSWTYDFLGQLTDDVTGTSGTGSLVFDPAGNRLTQTAPVTLDVTTLTYDSANRLLQATDVSGTTTYTYDANGNQLTIEEPGGDITTNTWDGENRLVQVEHPSGDIVTYAYNGDGLCVLEDDGVQSLETLYDGLNRVLEADSGTIAADYTTTPEAYGDALSQHRSGDSSFYLWDGIRNVRQLTDGAEVVTDSYDFDGWGQSLGSSGSTASTQQWQGQSIAYRKDADAGPEVQYAMHHRNYNPKSGVFTAADPAKDDLNLYRYVHNNPVNRQDPSGLQEELGRGNPTAAESSATPPDTSGPTLLELQEKFARTKAQLQKANEALEAESQKCFLTHSEDRATELFARADYLRRRLWEIRDEIQKKYEVTVSTRERQNATADPYIAISRLSDAEKVAALLRMLGVSYPGQRTTLFDREAPPITNYEKERARLLIFAASEAPQVVVRYLDREINNAWIGIQAGAEALNNLTLPPTDRSTGYWDQVGQILTGEGKSVWNTAAGFVEAIGSPVQTLDAIWHPGTTFRAMAESARDRSVKVQGQGEVVMELVLSEGLAEVLIGRLLKSGKRVIDRLPGKLGFNRKPKAPDLPDCTCEAPNPSSSKKPDAVDNPVSEPSSSTSKPDQPETTSTPDLPEGKRVAPSKVIDTQLDNNLLSQLANPVHPNHAAAVAYAEANKAAGLSVNRAAYKEFLQNFSKDQFSALREKYGIKLIRAISLEELESVAQRLRKAFEGTGRAIGEGDAKVAASALLRGEKLATNDLQFFKRAKDLGLNVDYVGSGNAAANAAKYVPQPVTIP